ncbi:hypothetical protein FRC01_006464 [Tulasnella sp. 417]|nr:hypothetical protein FRC01_006464 [Tulasnella sp. 417]
MYNRLAHGDQTPSPSRKPRQRQRRPRRWDSYSGGYRQRIDRGLFSFGFEFQPLELPIIRKRFEQSKVRPSQLSNVVGALSRFYLKKQARRLVDKLIAVNEGKGDPAEAAKQRSSVAAALLKIVHTEQGGGEIVARRFVKSSSRRAEGTRALLQLSDDELEKFGAKIISGLCTRPPTPSEELLALVSNHSNEVVFFWETFSLLLGDGTMDGPAAILYLATTETWRFFFPIGDHIIFDFCARIISTHEVLSPKWYCAVKLLCLLLKYSDCSELEYGTELQSLLCAILTSLIHIVTEERRKAVSFMPEYEFVFRDLPVLPILAGCCERIESGSHLEALTSSTPLKPFLELLIRFVFPKYPSPRTLSIEGGLGVYTLISLLKIPSIAKLFRDIELSRVGSFLVDMVLNSWTLEFRSASTFEKDILKPLTVKEDLYITCLCSLPGSTFSVALSGALKEGIVRLDAPTTNPYEPLGLVERLLWLSNAKVMKEQTHRALVDGGGCEFLVQALHYRGVLSSDDRGLWRARGLAMTCLGNIIERMNKEQFSNRVKEDMIASVVAIKEDKEVPLVQKGQAIFLLQRYTLAADRLGLQPFHREDISNMAEEFRNVDPDKAVLPPSAPDGGSESSALPRPGPLPLRRLTLDIQPVSRSCAAEEPRNIDPDDMAASSSPRADAGLPVPHPFEPRPPPTPFIPLDVRAFF